MQSGRRSIFSRGERLAGKVAIVTGAGCVGPGWGNGRAAAVLFAAQGARVVAVDRDAASMAETLESIDEDGGQAITCVCDVTDGRAVRTMVETVLVHTTPAWASANTDLVQRFAAAIEEASGWANRIRNHQKSAAILAKYAHVDADTLAQMSRAVYAETLAAADVQPTIDFGARFKILDASFPAAGMIFRANGS